MSLLASIHGPSDLKRLELPQLETLAGEIRQAIFEAVSINGGHLASNLGVVELTLALHRVYDFGPHPVGPDWLMFDVGHQCYPHKMLTGRAGMFKTLRKQGSVGGFPMPEESAYDLFNVGHAGTAISTAVGMARAAEAMGQQNHVVAVVGDASIVNGVAFEGLNNAGTLKRQMLIVLNDNGMSISEPQGAFSQYLERVRVSTTYEQFKRFSEKIVHSLPGSVGRPIEHAWDAFCAAFKGAMFHGQLFEALGIKYMGPIDGHDLPGLINFLAEIKHVDRPVLLHVKTVKGHGYEVTKEEPTKLHSPAPFVVNGCRVEIKSGGRNWTTAFADACIEIARQDPRVHALTAAMPDGTGLSRFAKVLPKQYLDTGICESHLVAMAAGMSKAGLRPIAAVYSTFAQRAFDQLWQEIALNRLSLVLAMDRAGFVGDDGAVHHGFMDQAFLRPLPGAVLMAPADEGDLRRMLRLAVSLTTLSAIRYPRDAVPDCDYDRMIHPKLREQAAALELGVSRVLRDGHDATILNYGALAGHAMTAAERLAQGGLEVEIVDARFCKPLDHAMLERVLTSGRPVLTLEDHVLTHGFGAAVIEAGQSAGLPVGQVVRLGHPPDVLVPHATRAQQLASTGLDADGVERALRALLRRPASRAGRSTASTVGGVVAHAPDLV